MTIYKVDFNFKLKVQHFNSHSANLGVISLDQFVYKVYISSIEVI